MRQPRIHRTGAAIFHYHNVKSNLQFQNTIIQISELQRLFVIFTEAILVWTKRFYTVKIAFSLYT
jgi:hypothetical protein